MKDVHHFFSLFFMLTHITFLQHTSREAYSNFEISVRTVSHRCHLIMYAARQESNRVVDVQMNITPPVRKRVYFKNFTPSWRIKTAGKPEWTIRAEIWQHSDGFSRNVLEPSVCMCLCKRVNLKFWHYLIRCRAKMLETCASRVEWWLPLIICAPRQCDSQFGNCLRPSIQCSIWVIGSGEKKTER